MFKIISHCSLIDIIHCVENNINACNENKKMSGLSMINILQYFDSTQCLEQQTKMPQHLQDIHNNVIVVGTRWISSSSALVRRVPPHYNCSTEW